MEIKDRFKERFPECSKLNIDSIVDGINNSPLTEKVKQEAIAIVKEQAEDIEPWLQTGRYQAPELHYEIQIANFIMGLITPVLTSNNVSPSHGRDTTRYIYDALGGRQVSQYESANRNI